MLRRTGSFHPDDDDYNTDNDNESANVSHNKYTIDAGSTKTPKRQNKKSSSSRHRSRNQISTSKSNQKNSDAQSVSSASVMMQFLGLDLDRSKQITTYTSSAASASSNTKQYSSSRLKVSKSRNSSHHVSNRWGKKYTSKESRNQSIFSYFRNISKTHILLFVILILFGMYFFVSQPGVESIHETLVAQSTTDHPLIIRAEDARLDEEDYHGIRGSAQGNGENYVAVSLSSPPETNENSVETTNKNVKNEVQFEMSKSLIQEEEDEDHYSSNQIDNTPKYDMSSSLIDNLLEDDETMQIINILDDPNDKMASMEELPNQNIPKKKDNKETPNPPPIQESLYKVGYVLPVYECPDLKPRDDTSPLDLEITESLEDSSFLDAAAILKYTIHRNSIHNPMLSPPSKYSYQMLALLHPSVKDCFDVDGYSRTDALQLLGYDVRTMDIPVPLDEIQNEFLRNQIPGAMESKERNLIRLQAFGLVEFDVVVLMDLRTLIVEKLDDLIDIVAFSNDESKGTDRLEGILQRVELVDASRSNQDQVLQQPISAIYTRDYSSVTPEKRNVGISPNLVVLKPSQTIYNEFMNILKEGDYRRDSGWGGSGIGGFLGDMTTRGILAYYYDILHPSNGIEVNHCRYNNMASNPYIRMNGSTVCRNGNEKPPNCQDCRNRSIQSSDISVMNMSTCRDPWNCYHHSETTDSLRLCRNMHSFWFQTRRELENAWKEHGGGGKFGYVPSILAPAQDRIRPNHFLGYCAGSGKNHYIPMAAPGKELVENGPALDTNAILNQFATGLNDDGNKKIPKPKKRFDPMKVMYQFANDNKI